MPRCILCNKCDEIEYELPLHREFLPVNNRVMYIEEHDEYRCEECHAKIQEMLFEMEEDEDII